MLVDGLRLLAVDAEAALPADQQHVGDLCVHVVQPEVQVGGGENLRLGLLPDQPQATGYAPENGGRDQARKTVMSTATAAIPRTRSGRVCQRRIPDSLDGRPGRLGPGISPTSSAKEAAAVTGTSLAGAILLIAATHSLCAFEGTETMQTLIVGRDITGLSAFT